MTLALKNAILKGGVSHVVLPDEVQNVPSVEEADTPAPIRGRRPLPSQPTEARSSRAPATTHDPLGNLFHLHHDIRPAD